MARSAEYILGAKWAFTEGSGTTLGDSVGSNDGTLNNSPTWISDGAAYALRFDGTSGQSVTFPTVQTTANASSDPRVNSNYYWFVKLWVRTSSASGKAFWQLNQYTTNEPVDNLLYVGTDGHLWANSASIFQSNYLDCGPIADSEWHEIGVMHCGGTPEYMIYRIWVDKALKHEKTGLSEVVQSNSNGYWKIGGAYIPDAAPACSATTEDQPFTGDIKDIEIYWWNGEPDICTGTKAAAEALLEYVAAASGYRNSAMLFCGGLTIA